MISYTETVCKVWFIQDFVLFRIQSRQVELYVHKIEVFKFKKN